MYQTKKNYFGAPIFVSWFINSLYCYCIYLQCRCSTGIVLLNAEMLYRTGSYGQCNEHCVGGLRKSSSSSSSISSMSPLSSGSTTNDDMSIASVGDSYTSNSDESMSYLQLSGTVWDWFCVCFVLTFVRRLQRGFLGSEKQKIKDLLYCEDVYRWCHRNTIGCLMS